jgi:phosphoglycerol transferase MdoB-like AlkP superfamily enzyme
VSALVAANLLLFAAYRGLFLHGFAAGLAPGEVLAVLRRGLRLDLALLGQELFALAALALLTRHLRYRATAGALWGLTLLHALVGAVNLVVYRERNQHVWETLLANLHVPREVWVATAPYLAANLHAPALAAAAMGGLAVAARRHLRTVAGRADLWRPRSAALAGAALLGLALPSVDLVQSDEPTLPGGYRTRLVSSMRSMGLTGHAANQAVVNPVYDLVHEHLPGAFGGSEAAPLDRDEALATALALLGTSPADPRYPLLRTIAGRGGLGLDNVVIVQVEGLGASILEHRVGGVPVMPFLGALAAEGLYLDNVYQSFRHTDGAVYATVTGLPPTPRAMSHAAKLSDRAVRGHYGSLPRLLDADGYRHHFLVGFRQRVEEFVGFMGNQGYQTLGFAALVERLGARAEQDVSPLGILDGPLLQEAARVLAATPGRFTAHVLTSSSHSPWIVPAGAPRPFGGTPLDVFRYVDDSLRALVERLRERDPRFARTLFVVLGDHTSVTVGPGLRERLRVPVVLWSAGLPAHRDRWAARRSDRADQLDVVPTILGLLDGPHRYAGMGRDVLGEPGSPRGAIVGGHPDTLYVAGEFALRYSAQRREGQLLSIAGGEIALDDVAARHPEVVRRLTRELLALQQTADRLTAEGRVSPP